MKTQQQLYKLPVLMDEGRGRVVDANGNTVVMMTYKPGKIDQQRDVLRQIAVTLNAEPETTEQGVCPKCGSDQLNWDNPEIDDGFASQKGGCMECNCDFTEHYQYTHTEIDLDSPSQTG